MKTYKSILTLGAIALTSALPSLLTSCAEAPGHTYHPGPGWTPRPLPKPGPIIVTPKPKPKPPIVFHPPYKPKPRPIGPWVVTPKPKPKPIGPWIVTPKPVKPWIVTPKPKPKPPVVLHPGVKKPIYKPGKIYIKP